MKDSTNSLEALPTGKPYFWTNPDRLDDTSPIDKLSPGIKAMLAAEQRFKKFAPLLEMPFPGLAKSAGTIESELVSIPSMFDRLNATDDGQIIGQLWLKADHSLPVAGSIKARGGIYEVLCFAEELAEQGRQYLQDDKLEPVMPQAVHILWTIGGLYVPEVEYNNFYERGRMLSNSN